MSVGEPRKIAIIGTAPDSVDFAPWDNPAWEVWIVKAIQVPRWDAVFEVHPPGPGMARWPEPYKQFLRAKHGKPIYMAQPAEWVPDAKPFPWQKLVEMFQTRYFTNSVSWMTAYAIAQESLGLGKVSDIGLWGIDMAQTGVGVQSEYAYQRPSCEFFLGIAKGMGINVHVPEQSDLLKCRKLYGVEDDDLDAKVATKLRNIQTGHEHAAQMEQKWRDKRLVSQGVIQGLAYLSQWKQGGKDESQDSAPLAG